MPDSWYYVSGTQSLGPVAEEALRQLVNEGKITPATLVWKEGFQAWLPAQQVPDLIPQQVMAAIPPPVPAGPPPVPAGSGGGGGAAGMLRSIGQKISEVSDLPTLTNVPVGQIIMGGLKEKTQAEDIEKTFTVGSVDTTPPLSEVIDGWPSPRVFWRVLGGAIVTYILLYVGITQYGNTKFVPGMIAIGGFIMPLALVVLFYEMNTPRNVSVYQVGKMLLLGGAISLIATMVLHGFTRDSGWQAVLGGMAIGVIEETAKAVPLLLLVNVSRYRWQMNGLLLGAAVGAGFEGFETSGYAFDEGLIAQGSHVLIAIDKITDELNMRGLTAPAAHVIWTAMVGSAIWKVKGDRKFEPGMLFHKEVIRRWAIAVVLHGLWDSRIPIHPYIVYIVLGAVGWYIIFAILKQSIAEVALAKEQARAAAAQ